jgi:hypothetical protein
MGDSEITKVMLGWKANRTTTTATYNTHTYKQPASQAIVAMNIQAKYSDVAIGSRRAGLMAL